MSVKNRYPLYWWSSYGLHPTPEFRFSPERRWRFDYAFPTYRIGVEIDGGLWSYGRHNRGSGYTRDMEKLNEAARLGWKVFRFSPEDLKAGRAQRYIHNVIACQVT